MGNTNSLARNVETEKNTNPSKEVTRHDPRSPTQGVSRTPLRIETDISRQQQSLDPRSPSGIDRTPIQVTTQKRTAGVKVTLDYENESPPLLK